jgi:protein-S-isoprenylcysteine O-methyltransferase Ste14
MTLPIASLPLFVGGTVLLLVASWRALLRPGSHGYYRFFAWEAILVLILLNREARGNQVLSESLLQLSLLCLMFGFIALLRHGRRGQRDDAALYTWEKTTAMVTDGVFSYIRHPMYAALLGLAWGVFFRAISWQGLGLVLFASFFLWRTAQIEERECIDYFGRAYIDYMRRTRRFIPWLF